MLVIISQIFKLLIILGILLYTFLCFFAFKFHNEQSRKGIYVIQRVCIFTIIVLGFSSLAFNLNESKYLIMMGAIIVVISIVMISYSLFYKYANTLVTNNMCILLAVGMIIISRLNFDKAIRQFVIMTVALIVTFFIPYFVSKIKVFAGLKWLYAGIGLATLLLVLVFSNMVNGSKINISIANYTFQPSEFVKILFVLAIAAIIYDRPSLSDVLVSASLAAVHVLLLVASKDLGSAVIFFIVYFAMLFVATGRIYYYLSGFVLLVVSSIIGYKMFSHVRVRVEAFTDPFGTIDTSGFQIAQSLFAIGSGGMMGRGLGLGAPKNIPVVVSDFVFSAIAEEFGVIFCVCLILICVSNMVMFFNISMRFKDNYYKLIALGLGVAYGFQVFLTIGGVTKFIPITGVTLPLVSYGGTSVAVTLIVFNIIQGLYIDKERIKIRNRAIVNGYTERNNER